MNPDIYANPRIQRWAGLLILFTILWSLAMGIQEKQFDEGTSGVVRKCGSPVACLELAATAENVRELVDAGNCAQSTRKCAVNLVTLRQNTYMDFIFIVFYCSTFVLLAFTYRGIRFFPALTLVLMIVAGIFDCLENRRMLEELSVIDTLQSDYVHITRTVSMTKWIALVLALFCLAIIFLRAAKGVVPHPRALGWIGLFFFLSAVGIVVGLLDPRWIVTWVLPLLLANVLSLYVFRPWAPAANNT